MLVNMNARLIGTHRPTVYDSDSCPQEFHTTNPSASRSENFPTSPTKSIRKIVHEAFHPIRSPTGLRSRFVSIQVRHSECRATKKAAHWAAHQRSFLGAIEYLLGDHVVCPFNQRHENRWVAKLRTIIAQIRFGYTPGTGARATSIDLNVLGR